jgi:hypothetical protein
MARLVFEVTDMPLLTGYEYCIYTSALHSFWRLVVRLYHNSILVHTGKHTFKGGQGRDGTNTVNSR